MSTATLPPPPGLPLPQNIPTNNANLGPQILVASWALTSLAALFLFTRIFAKLWTRRGLWVDDYVLIVAWLAVLVAAVASSIAVSKGLGRHVSYVPVENIDFLSALLNVSVTVLILASALSKTSFVMTVLRLVSGHLRWAAWFILVSTNVLLGINIALLWVTFVPHPATAGPASPSMVALGISLSTYGIFITAYSAAMDFALVGMAWSVASRLHMRSTREKVGVGIAMSMGMIAGAASIVKAAIFPTLSNGDISYTSASLHIWSIAEPSITIVAASIPLLRVLFSHVTSLTTRSRALRSRGGAGAGNSSTGPSFGGSERWKRSMSAQVSSMQSGRRGPYDFQYGDLSTIKGSEEDVMLEHLGEVSRVKTGDSLETTVVEYTQDAATKRGEGKDIESKTASGDGRTGAVGKETGRDSRRTTVGYGFGPVGVYETKLAQKYAMGYTTPEPGMALQL